jgi:hypothetical protein
MKVSCECESDAPLVLHAGGAPTLAGARRRRFDSSTVAGSARGHGSPNSRASGSMAGGSGNDDDDDDDEDSGDDADVVVSAVAPATITVRNRDSIPVAAKVTARRPGQYLITPRKVIVAPHSAATMSVFLAPPPEEGAAAAPPAPAPPLSDLIRVEIRAVLGLSPAEAKRLPAAEFGRYWATAIPQDAHTIPVRLQHLGRPAYVRDIVRRHAALAAAEQEAGDRVRRDAEQTAAAAARCLLTNAGYRDDVARVRHAVAVERRGRVTVHWVVALAGLVAAWVASGAPLVW